MHTTIKPTKLAKPLPGQLKHLAPVVLHRQQLGTSADLHRRDAVLEVKCERLDHDPPLWRNGPERGHPPEEIHGRHCQR